MISISPVALDRDAIAPVIYFTCYIYNHRKDVLMSKWNTYKHMQDSGTFFADYGMMLMQTLQEAVEGIQILSEIANDCGLGINKNKSNIIIFNSKNQHEYIEDMHVTTNLTYLGVKIQNEKDCYKLQRIEA